jgi:hypothetical protein
VIELEKANFEMGKPARALSDRILEFLVKNRGKAYGEGEISLDLLQAGDPVVKELTAVGRQAVVLAALDNLIRDGKVLARTHAWNTYYMYNEPPTTAHAESQTEDDTRKGRHVG